METAKVFVNGRSQAVRLPKKYRLDEPEIFVQRVGNVILLIPKENRWQTFLDGVNSFTEDFFEDGRMPEQTVERETL